MSRLYPTNIQTILRNNKVGRVAKKPGPKSPENSNLKLTVVRRRVASTDDSFYSDVDSSPSQRDLEDDETLFRLAQVKISASMVACLPTPSVSSIADSRAGRTFAEPLRIVPPALEPMDDLSEPSLSLSQLHDLHHNRLLPRIHQLRRWHPLESFRLRLVKNARKSIFEGLEPGKKTWISLESTKSPSIAGRI
jgi:hypothetical protein